MREISYKKLPGLAIVIIAILSILSVQGLQITMGQTAGTPNYSSWRASLSHIPTPQAGCFTVTYPSMAWQSIHCVTAPRVPLAPSTVGDGADEVAYSGSGKLIGSSTGSFPSVSGLTSETDSDGSGNCGSPNGANCYGLQDNTNIFTTATIYTGGRSALGWEQFVFINYPEYDVGYIFIQYWLIGYGSTCPIIGPPAGSSWIYYGGGNGASGCYANSYSAESPSVAAANLGNLVLTGYANFNSNDENMVCISTSCYSTSEPDGVLDLYQQWQYSEINVFGFCCGSQANFNSGTSITVANALEDQSRNVIVPSCVPDGYTAETNNQNLDSCSSNSKGQIVFTESNGNTVTQTLIAGVDSGQGSISPSCPGGCSEAAGSPQTITATPSTGWQFSSWSINGASCSGGSSSNPCQFNMPDNAVTITAIFTQPQITSTTSFTILSSTTRTSSTSMTSYSTVVSSSRSTTSAPTLITHTLTTTTSVSGAVAGTSTITFTSPLVTSYSTITASTGSSQIITQTRVTTVGTILSATTTSTATVLSSTTVGGTVSVSQTDTFDALLTTIFQVLHQFSDGIFRFLGIRVTATPVGQQVRQVVVTVPTLTTTTVSFTDTSFRTTTLQASSSTTTNTVTTAPAATVATITLSPLITGSLFTTVTTTGSVTGMSTTTFTQIFSTSTSTSRTTLSTYATTLQTLLKASTTSATATSSSTSFRATTSSGKVKVTQMDTFTQLITLIVQVLHQLASKIIEIFEANVRIVKTPIGRVVHRVTVVK